MSTDRGGPTAAIALTLIAAAHAPDVADREVIARARRDPEHQHIAESIDANAIQAPQRAEQAPPDVSMPIGRQLVETAEVHNQHYRAAHAAEMASCIFPRNAALLDLVAAST
jgi:hypothetical protein